MLATAICSGCDAFLTNDAELAKIKDIKVLNIEKDDLLFHLI